MLGHVERLETQVVGVVGDRLQVRRVGARDGGVVTEAESHISSSIYTGTWEPTVRSIINPDKLAHLGYPLSPRATRAPDQGSSTRTQRILAPNRSQESDRELRHLPRRVRVHPFQHAVEDHRPVELSRMCTGPTLHIRPILTRHRTDSVERRRDRIRVLSDTLDEYGGVNGRAHERRPL